MGERPHAVGAGRSAPAPLAPVLVVEDDPVAAVLVQRHLGALGLANPVVVASDGEEAVGWLSGVVARPDADVPALILLDRHLPGRSGLDVLRWIHAEPALRSVPVLVLTASSDVDGISEAYALGARSYLVKPVGFEALSDVVRGLSVRWAILPSEDRQR